MTAWLIPMDERQHTEGIRLLLQMLGQGWRHCDRDVEFFSNNGEVIHRIHVPSSVPWIFFGVSFSVTLPALEADWIVCFQLAYPNWAKPKTWRPTFGRGARPLPCSLGQL